MLHCQCLPLLERSIILGLGLRPNIYIYIDNELLGPTPLHYHLSHIQINFFFQGNSMVLKTESIKIQKKGLVFSFYGLNHHLLPF